MSQQEILRIVGEVVALAIVLAVALSVVVRRSLQAQGEMRAQHDREVQALRQEFEATKKEAEVAAREELLRQREALEAEYREKKALNDSEEHRLRERDASLEERRAKMEERESELSARFSQLAERERQAERKFEEAESELAQIAGLDRATARKQFLARVEQENRDEAAKRVKAMEQAMEQEVGQRARRTLIQVMERTNAEYVTEATVAVVSLPNDDMKGRLIGREGRNIRAFEQVTGVDLIIDDTPEAVVISSFDPIRRETARLALMNLMLDGRIHPGRIEELYEKAQAEVQKTVEEAGERAAERANVAGLPPRVVEAMGRLRFRTSMGQNVLDHSVETAQIAAMLASELGLNVELSKRAGFLHDIGKGLPPEWEGPHALAGMEFLRQFDFKESLLNSVGAHHREIEPLTPEAEVVIVADSMSAARPGARRENLENYVKRLTALEALANGFPGVERSYAMQAGRELRVVVMPDRVDDIRAAQIAKDLAKKIEAEMEYPGQVRVTVIRETRIQEIAK